MQIKPEDESEALERDVMVTDIRDLNELLGRSDDFDAFFVVGYLNAHKGLDRSFMVLHK